MTFLETLHDLDASATAAPWESDDGEGYSLLRLRAAKRTVAEIPGDDAATNPTGDLIVLLRNSSSRLAALVEAVAAYKGATDAREEYDAEGRDGDTYDCALSLAEEHAYCAMLAALAALEAP